MAAAEVAQVEDWIGSGTLDPQAIQDVLDRFDDDVLAASRSILRNRRAQLVAMAAELSVDQDYQRKIAEWQIAALDTDIARLDKAIAEAADEDTSTLPVVGLARLVRHCPGR